jgi:4-amino-4-deoxy-L-arabinose transferase-like glycosyltransferase
MPTSLSAAVDRMLIGFASLFEKSPPAQRSRPWERLAVLGIVIAAAFVRFWGLGGWGLEGDEDTMALPAVHILRDGRPLLPSGMFYGRGIAQLYMMAASMRVFGESAWAMRVPSVLCGLLLIVLAFWYGRRFLSPAWNMAFVASVAFLPGTIADSQEARMYIFLLATLAGYTILIFEWERTDRLVHLFAAVLVMLIGISFHTLAVFGAFIVFFPGLLCADRRKLVLGASAFTVIVLGFELNSRWITSLYPPRPAMFGVAKLIAGHDYGISHLHAGWALALGNLMIAAVLSVFVANRVVSGWPAKIAGALLFAGLACQSMLFYHLGILLLVLGAIVAQRHGGMALPRLAVLAATSAAIAIVHIVVLHRTLDLPVRKVLGLIVGLPSIWSYLNLADFSPVAGLILAVAAMRMAWLLARGRKIPDYWLFLLLSGGVPLFLIGFFSWYTDPRYTEFALVAALLGAFAPWPRAAPAIMAALVCVLVVNPMGMARVIDAGYSIHPDHEGAAEFMRSLTLEPKDIVLAEDVIEQTYYLDHVDYWLIGKRVASEFAEQSNGRTLDIYTHTPIIESGAALAELIARPERGAIYVIGSGEDQEDGRRFVREAGIDDLMKSKTFHVVFTGRDGLTHVWKVDPRKPTDAHPPDQL